MGTQTEFWKNQKQFAKPIKEDLLDSHLTSSAVNPKVIAKMHDRGAEVNAKLFLEGNANVDHRPGKIKLEDDHTAGSFQRDYVELQGVWQAVDAAWNYATALRSIRPGDHSGHLILKTLHDVRFFVGACRKDSKRQQKMILDFMNNVFRKNSLKGRCREPPLDWKQVMDEARSVMIKNVWNLMAELTEVSLPSLLELPVTIAVAPAPPTNPVTIMEAGTTRRFQCPERGSCTPR